MWLPRNMGMRPMCGRLSSSECASTGKRILLYTHFRSKRSRDITLAHAFTKSRTNISFPSAAA